MKRLQWIAGASCLLMSALLADATDVASRIVGYNVVDCPAGSDTIVSVPFHRPASFSGAVQGTIGVNGTEATITPKANPTFTAGEFLNEPHYLQFVGTGVKRGYVFQVIDQTTSSVKVDLGDSDVSGVIDGDRFEIIPHWTLETLFPKASQATIHVSDSKLANGRKTRVLFFDDTTPGLSLAPDRIFFLTADGWFRSDTDLPAADDEIIAPGKAFVIRHPASEAATKFIPHQMVMQSQYSTPLRRRSDGRQDNVVALVRPVPVKLSELDLGLDDFVDSDNNDSENRADELLIYDNLSAAINKQPDSTYFRVGGEWRLDDGSTYPESNEDVISPSTGIVIRKASTASTASLRWLNVPRY